MTDVIGVALICLLLRFLASRMLHRYVTVGSKWAYKKDPWASLITIIDKRGNQIRYTFDKYENSSGHTMSAWYLVVDHKRILDELPTGIRRNESHDSDA